LLSHTVVKLQRTGVSAWAGEFDSLKAALRLSSSKAPPQLERW